MHSRHSMFFAIMATACCIICSTVNFSQAEAAETKPRILLLVDTSGSMAWDIAGFRTNGDGTKDPWDGTGRTCCPGAGGSRLYIAKEAMTKMILAAGDIEFALMKFPQRYWNSGPVADCADDDCGTWQYRYNQTAGARDRMRYYFLDNEEFSDIANCECEGEGCGFIKDFSRLNRPNWLLEEFSADSVQEIASWMDHHEFSATAYGQADTSLFTGPHGDLVEQELRAEGFTPLGESIEGAYQYLGDVMTADIENLDCRPYSLIVLSDGDPELPDSCSGGPADPIGAVANLYDIGKDSTLFAPGDGTSNVHVRTWVVGLAHSSATLDAMAAEGGTTSAYSAFSLADLSEILYTIISESVLYEQCNYIDDDCDGETDEDFRTGKTFCDPTGWVAANCPGTNCPCPGPNCPAGVSDSGHPGATTDQIMCIEPPEMYCDGVDDNCNGETDEGNWTVHLAGRDDDLKLGTPCGGGPIVGHEDYGICERGTLYCAPGEGWQCAGATGPLEEICDGVDNDCDGQTDEVEDHTPCSNHANTTDSHCLTGARACEGGTWVCNQDELAEADEVTCDGIDNDCDGQTDEDIYRSCGGCDPAVYSAAPYNCTLDEHRNRGECLAGHQACQFNPPNAAWGACQGEVAPKNETCNLLDDNCDGQTDEGLGGGPCGPPCNTGHWECNDAGNMVCVGAGLPEAEVCDGIDNDCDGQTDENLTQECGTEGNDAYWGVGICRKGSQNCDFNPAEGFVGWHACQGEQLPRAETCNLLDDDCDGKIDEGNDQGDPIEDPTTCGVCEDGKRFCIGGAMQCCKSVTNGKCDPINQPTPETCNAIDDNCDGQTDEGLYQACGGCDPALYPAPSWECDEFFPDQGTCLLGFRECIADVQGEEKWGDCQFGQGPSLESCNGLDDDCDGKIDEEIIGSSCGPCGDGTEYCINSRMTCCKTGSYNGLDPDTCASPTAPVPEICNGEDEDCDGQTDENLTQECGTKDNDAYWGVGICHKGTQNCDYIPELGFVGWHDCVNEQLPEEEECDCLDNDCDGQTDEDAEGNVLTDGTCDFDGKACGTRECSAEICDYVCSSYGSNETCNGLDDNCNNLVDEGVYARCGGCDADFYSGDEYPLDDCLAAQDAGAPPDEGECQRGIRDCVAELNSGIPAWSDCQGSIGPKQETCDDKDNDCDGLTDEEIDINLAGDQCRTSTGICEAGWWKCVNDGAGGKRLDCCSELTGDNECIPPRSPVYETCNGLDDDCDGETDEDADLPEVGASCGSDVGICESGTLQCICQGDNPDEPNCEIVCVGFSGKSDEVCNGLDDDCDGLTDENLPLGDACSNSPTGKPIGECQDGFEACINGEWDCNAKSPTEERCNGLDDDCDGETDENLDVECPGESLCIQGQCGDSCQGEEMACPLGKTCEIIKDADGNESKICVSNICEPSSPEALPCVTNPYWCDDGHKPPCTCDAIQGKCVGLCDDVTCPEGKVCISQNGSCQTIEESCWTSGCTSGNICVDGSCVADPCAEADCEEDKYCNSAGECVSSCVNLDCPRGCFEGECVDDFCQGVFCPPGWQCDSETGNCVKGGPCTNVPCKFHEICKDGECIDDPCWNINCPNGLRCIDGACYEYVPEDTDDVDTESDTDFTPGTDSGSHVDTSGGNDSDSSSNGGNDGPSVITQVLASGSGGCLCSSTPGRSSQSQGIAVFWTLLSLILLLARSHRRPSAVRARLILASTVVLGSLLALGCSTDPYDFLEDHGGKDGGTDDGHGTSSHGTDPSSDGDSDSTDDTNPSTDSFICDSFAADDDCDGVDEDCDGFTDEDVNTNTSTRHCGKCNNPCEYRNAFGKCEEGNCVMQDCAAYWWDKNESDTDGCEYYCEPKGEEDRCNGVDLGEGLYQGIDDDCDGETDEDVDFKTSILNCGRCGRICRLPHAHVKCEAGVCKFDGCEDGYYNADSDEANGCEYRCDHTPSDELCNNIDDDCDGKTDEDNPEGGAPCFTADNGCVKVGDNYECKGICVAGEKACLSGTLQCRNQTPPEVFEDCNGLDDDCDGQTDELLFHPCETLTGDDVAKYGVGVCMRGAQTCHDGKWGAIKDGVWTADYCAGEILPGQEECNGADDNCDGLTDNDISDKGSCSFVSGGLPADTGICEPGTMLCLDGEWVCSGGTPPRVGGEICNGLDDDCDGIGDAQESIKALCGGCDAEAAATWGCNEANPNEGLCQQGTRICIGDDQWGPCLATTGPKKEECDGFDNDCDGETDEDVTQVCGGGPIGKENTGLCRQGTRTCNQDPANPAFGDCIGSTEPQTEICDGQDQDCDGVEDNLEGIFEDCGTFSPDLDGIGICRLGRRNCTASAGSGPQWTNCIGAQGPLTEECNGLDDDCDGVTDEDSAGDKLTRNTCGPCNDGLEYCINGSFQCCESFNGTTCEGSLKQPTGETCNGQDDDCDGIEDAAENLTRLCGGGPLGNENTGQCRQGTQVCDATPGGAESWTTCQDSREADAETCNGLDDDCDGDTDEDETGAPLADGAPPLWCNDEACGAAFLGSVCNSTTGWECVYDCGTGPGKVQCDTEDQVLESETACDSEDNDCDGETDEGLLSRLATCGSCSNNCNTSKGPNVASYACIGETCTITACAANFHDINGTWSDGCEYGCTASGSERAGGCNGIDEDCDGLTDEGAGSPEICDGLDNDCDNNVDEVEELTPPEGICNSTGLCAQVGAITPECNGAAGWRCKLDCAQVDCADDYTLAANESSCDGLDNNCNGQIDESFVSENHPPYGTFLRNAKCNNAAEGACFVQGIARCKEGGTDGDRLICCSSLASNAVCSAGDVLNMAPAAGDELGTPDGIDNDCDGLTDEGTSCAVATTIADSHGNNYQIFRFEGSKMDATSTGQGTVESVACSQTGVVPWTSVSLTEAQAACRGLNDPSAVDCDLNPHLCWDLCSAAQYEFACAYGADVGSAPHDYPYGNTYGATTCNGKDYNPTADALLATGTATACAADWDTAGRVYDLSGNAEEWTKTSRSSAGQTEYEIRGGSYNDLAGGLQCDYDFWAAAAEFRLPNLGFRCCLGPDPVFEEDPCASTTCADVLSSIANHPYDFEGDGFCSDDGWFLSGEWEAADPTWDPAIGSCVMATDADDTYDNLAEYLAQSPSIDLSCCAGEDVALKFRLVYSMEHDYVSCDYDYGHVQVFDGTTWAVVTPTQGYVANQRWCATDEVWREYTVNVSDYVSNDFRVMFRLHSDSSVVRQGMYVDDVELVNAYVDAGPDGDTDTDTDVDTDTGADTDTDTDTDTGSGTVLECNVVDPEAIAAGADTEFAIVGAAFANGMTATLVDVDNAANTYSLGAASSLTETGAIFDVLATQGLAAGTYYVDVQNTTGSPVRCEETLGALSAGAPTVTAVSPALVWNGDTSDGKLSDLEVDITGNGFTQVPIVTWIKTDDPSLRYASREVYYDTGSSLRATCPAESQAMPAGTYYVYVSNFQGVGAYWTVSGVRGVFTVTGTPPPKIDELSPFRAPASSGINTTITGTNFNLQKVELILPAPAAPLALNVVSYNATTIVISDPVSLAHAAYPVRVTNIDGQYDDYYYWGVTSGATAHLGDFEQFLVSPGTYASLDTPRWRLGAVEGFDEFLGSYIYAAGGLDAGGNVLDTVEIVPLSITGDPGYAWIAEQWNDVTNQRIDNTLLTARQGLALVRAGKWLYALGGVTADNTKSATPTVNAIASVERAEILGHDTQPQDVFSYTTGAGSVGPGVFYYQVSAIGPWGESLPSTAQIVYAASGSTVQITWEAVSGATGYNVYRNVNPTGDGGTTYHLAKTANTSFTDNGSGAPDGTTTPLPHGSLSLWTATSSLGTAREGAGAITVAILGNGGTRKFLYVVGGRKNNLSATDYLTSTEMAEVLSDGSLSTFANLGVELTTPRAFFKLLTNLGQEYFIGPSSDPGEGPLETGGEVGDLMLIAVQGDNSYIESPTNDGLDSFEIARIVKENGAISGFDVNGDPVDTWTEQSFKTSQVVTHGHGAELFFDHLFVFNGVSKETYADGLTPLGSKQKRVEYHEDALTDNAILDVAQASGSAFLSSRAYYGMVRLNGYIFLIGGNRGPKNGGPVGLIERCLQ